MGKSTVGMPIGLMKPAVGSKTPIMAIISTFQNKNIYIGYTFSKGPE